ncbi:MAG: PepSY-associated TM helix domain-containing protein [Cellvibrio sp.]
MRGPLLKIYKTLHTWTGLASSIALFIAFYAGALTMFKEPLERWSTPINADRQWISEAQYPNLIAQLIHNRSDAARSFTVNMIEQEHTPAPITWRKPLSEMRGGPSEGWSATLDDNGSLVVTQFEPSAMAELIDLLHQTAGIPGTAGHHAFGVYVLGVICLLYVLAIVSGFIVLLPTLIKDFFALRKTKNPKRFWLDAHNLVGITSLPFHIVIALTVIVFAFHDQIYASLGKLVYGERPSFEQPAPEPSTYRLEELLMPQELVKKVHAIAPTFVAREVSYNNIQTTRASVRIAGEDDDHMLRGYNRGFVTLNPYTGEILDKDYLPGHEEGYIQPVITFFSLHFGSFGGDPIRWMYFFLGISGSFLFYTGNLLWIESRRKRQRANQALVTQDKNAYLIANLTVGACWGSVAAISFAMAAGKWLQSVGDDPNVWYYWTYYSVFFACIAWTFWRGAARAVVELLYLCAITTALIPITGLIALVFKQSPLWLHTSSDLLLVEFTALVSTAIFIFMAKRTKQHLKTVPTDSVWYYPSSIVQSENSEREVINATNAEQKPNAI